MKITKIKIERFLATALCVVGSVLMFSLPALAQEDRGRDKDRRDRDSRDRDRDIEREKWKQNFDLKGFLTKLDDDKSGVLEGKELKSDRTRHFLAKMGINADSPVKIDAAVKKAKAVYADKRDAERKKFQDQVGPKLGSFGTQTESFGIDGFGATEAKEPTVASFDEGLTGLKITDFDEKTLSDARKTLDGYDRDKSGFLEGDEINRVRWKDPTPAESDLNNDGRLSLLEMAQRKSAARAKKSDRGDDRRARDDDRRDRERDYDRGRSDRASNGRPSRYESGSRAPTNASSPSSRSSSGGSNKSTNSDSAFTNYIDGVYKKYDTDKDNRLSPAELKKMRRPLKGDTNGDGFLSKKEATDYIRDDKSKKSASKPTATTTDDRSRDRGRGTNGRGSGDEAKRKKYTPPKNKTKSSSRAKSSGSLGGLDANSDGQIQMSEFSSKWDEETFEKFRKTDADQDGIISADEWSARPK